MEETRNDAARLRAVLIGAASFVAGMVVAFMICGILTVQAQGEQVEDQAIVEAMEAEDVQAEQVEEVAEEPIEEPAPEVVEQPEAAPMQSSTKSQATSTPSTYVGSNFKRDGVWSDGNYRYTWYSSRVAHHYRTDEWTPDESGVYRDSEGYAVVASSDLPQGSVVEDTPFGAAKVYDCGCPSGTLDVYVNY